MTEQEFIDGYCERSGISWEWLSKYRAVLPCDCGDPLCEGWAMVPKFKDQFDLHRQMYAPED